MDLEKTYRITERKIIFFSKESVKSYVTDSNTYLNCPDADIKKGSYFGIILLLYQNFGIRLMSKPPTLSAVEILAKV